MRGNVVIVCLLLVCGAAIVGQSAEWTIWSMPSEQSFPSDLEWMIDNSLFVALYEPQALARFEPENNRLIIWALPVLVSEFAIANPGLFFTAQRDGRIGWLQPDANYVELWSLPSPTAQPLFLRESSYGDGVENFWYLEWDKGRLGLFEPKQLTSTFAEGDNPVVATVTQTTRSVVAHSQVVDPVVTMGSADDAPATYLHEPLVTENFREWGLVTMDPPAYAVAEDAFGNVWVPDSVNATLLALSPVDNVVRVYAIPEDLWIGGLVPYLDSANICFSVHSETDGVSKIGMLQSETGSVALWDIPGGTEIDAVSLIVANGDLWFCDRGESCVYRLDLSTGTFTWWETGGDDSPLYITAGNPGEFWVSWEGTGKVARLRVND